MNAYDFGTLDLEITSNCNWQLHSSLLSYVNMVFSGAPFHLARYSPAFFHSRGSNIAQFSCIPVFLFLYTLKTAARLRQTRSIRLPLFPYPPGAKHETLGYNNWVFTYYQRNRHLDIRVLDLFSHVLWLEPNFVLSFGDIGSRINSNSWPKIRISLTTFNMAAPGEDYFKYRDSGGVLRRLSPVKVDEHVVSPAKVS